MVDFWNKYKGAIVGAIIGIFLAIFIVCTKLYNFIIVMVLLVLGAIVGNYVQFNKNEVKDRIKKFIDKM